MYIDVNIATATYLQYRSVGRDSLFKPNGYKRLLADGICHLLPLLSMSNYTWSSKSCPFLALISKKCVRLVDAIHSLCLSYYKGGTIKNVF